MAMTQTTNSIFKAATASVVLACSAASATAGDFDFLYPAADGQAGNLSKTGFIVNPDIDYNKLSFSGNGASQLKEAKGFRAGVELGYDYQVGNVVVGVMGAISYADIKGKESGGSPAQLRSNMDYFGSISGRLGYVFDRWMIYGTGGFAFAGLEIENRARGLKASQDMTGWTAGAGVEYVWNKSITLRGEYTRVDLSDEKFLSLPGANKEVGGEMDLIRVGVIKRF